MSFTDSYNPARQIVQSGLNNALFLYAPQANGTTVYTANGLNQYATVTQPGSSATTMGYDANGNLTADGTYTFAYDPENRLLSASQGGIMSASYSYDPMGRRSQKSVVGGAYAGTTVLVSSGDDEIADYCGNGSTLWHRYIPGPAVDQPLAAVTYADSTCAPIAAVKSYFHQDKTGSIVAMSNASGTLAEGPYTYDPFGNCITGGQACSGGIPYKYTGRRYDPETGLYYYRARYYSPSLGRFLQTDPIGYKDDLNWYAYVGNDPTDRLDPEGTTVVWADQSGAVSTTVGYMSRSSTFRSDFGQLQGSSTVYRVVVDRSTSVTRYDPASHTIVYNPTTAIRTGNGSLQSPAVGLGHEVDHAARDDQNHQQFIKDHQTPAGPIRDFIDPKTQMETVQIPDNMDEAKAVRAENAMARELGEPTRTDHGDGHLEKVPTPTTHCTARQDGTCR